MINASRVAHQRGIAKTMTAVLLTTTFVGVTAIHAEVPMKKVNITVENGSHASFVYVYANSTAQKLEM